MKLGASNLDFHGFEGYSFLFQGREAKVIRPKVTALGASHTVHAQAWNPQPPWTGTVQVKRAISTRTLRRTRKHRRRAKAPDPLALRRRDHGEPSRLLISWDPSCVKVGNMPFHLVVRCLDHGTHLLDFAKNLINHEKVECVSITKCSIYWLVRREQDQR
jgi:hypothetical protein